MATTNTGSGTFVVADRQCVYSGKLVPARKLATFWSFWNVMYSFRRNSRRGNAIQRPGRDRSGNIPGLAHFFPLGREAAKEPADSALAGQLFFVVQQTAVFIRQLGEALQRCGRGTLGLCRSFAFREPLLQEYRGPLVQDLVVPRDRACPPAFEWRYNGFVGCGCHGDKRWWSGMWCACKRQLSRTAQYSSIRAGSGARVPFNGIHGTRHLVARDAFVQLVAQGAQADDSEGDRSWFWVCSLLVRRG